MRCTNSSGDNAAKGLLKRQTCTCATPSARRISSFSRNEVSRVGAESGVKISRGCGSKVSTAGNAPTEAARAVSRASMAW